jgi:ABC-type amino acid transport substrate-binding protein
MGALLALVLGGCLPQSEPAPAPTARATAARPSFELATYMYALQTRGRIRIGALEKDIPFAVRDSRGVYVGFEVDLGRELAKGIFGGRQSPDAVIEWIPVTRQAADAVLVSGGADVVIARLPISPERQALVDLTDPYFVTGERILVRSSNDEIKELPDLETRTVCVERGSGVAEHVIDANEFARTLELDTYASCLGALQQGQVDAIGADEAILWNLMKIDSSTKLVGSHLTTERYAIGVKRHTGDRQGFVPFLNWWLAEAIRDGTWGRLYAQHVKPYSGETRTAPTP